MIRRYFGQRLRRGQGKFIVNAIVSDDSMDRYKDYSCYAYEKLKQHYKQHGAFYLALINTIANLPNRIGRKYYIEGNKLHASFKYFVGKEIVKLIGDLNLPRRGCCI